MTDLESELGRLEQTLDGLEGSIGGAEAMTTAFRSEMEDVTASMRVASRDASTLSRSFGTSLKGAMDDLILDGARLSDVLSNVGRSVTKSVLGSAIKPVSDALGGGVNTLISSLFADGAAFSSGRVRAFAQGGVVNGPTTFPMRGGTGLMGEAGPEAIMPLARGADGRLGVRAAGGGGAVNVTMNITSPDAASFMRSRTQVAAQLSRALGQGQRNQ
ncbi:MAG: phage tail tape measure protein [Pseudomonadota bacterium]